MTDQMLFFRRMTDQENSFSDEWRIRGHLFPTNCGSRNRLRHYSWKSWFPKRRGNCSYNLMSPFINSINNWFCYYCELRFLKSKNLVVGTFFEKTKNLPKGNEPNDLHISFLSINFVLLDYLYSEWPNI